MMATVLLATVLLLAAPTLAVAQEPTPPQAATQSTSAWPPVLVGALIGVLSWLTFAVSNKPIGASSSYASLAGLIGQRLAPRITNRLAYYREHPPRITWQVALIGGVVLGSMAAAATGGEFTARVVPEMWAARFGPAVGPRLLTALVGGAIMAFGARVAGGCTSGHGISGALQLSVGSWIALLCFFVGGVAIAVPLFRL